MNAGVVNAFTSAPHCVGHVYHSLNVEIVLLFCFSRMTSLQPPLIVVEAGSHPPSETHHAKVSFIFLNHVLFLLFCCWFFFCCCSSSSALFLFDRVSSCRSFPDQICCYYFHIDRSTALQLPPNETLGTTDGFIYLWLLWLLLVSVVIFVNFFFSIPFFLFCCIIIFFFGVGAPLWFIAAYFGSVRVNRMWFLLLVNCSIESGCAGVEIIPPRAPVLPDHIAIPSPGLAGTDAAGNRPESCGCCPGGSASVSYRSIRWTGRWIIPKLPSP